MVASIFASQLFSESWAISLWFKKKKKMESGSETQLLPVSPGKVCIAASGEGIPSWRLKIKTSYFAEALVCQDLQPFLGEIDFAYFPRVLGTKRLSLNNHCLNIFFVKWTLNYVSCQIVERKFENEDSRLLPGM